MEPYPILLVTLFGLCSSQTLNSDGVPVFSDCGGDITVNKGIITSPGYPGDYANNLMCRWRILTRVKNIQVRILLTDLNIWESENCESDFLRIVIHGGEARSYRLCGDKKGQSRNTTGHAPIDIVMQTDKENVTRGFKINFEVLSPCLSEPCQNGGTCDYDADSYNCSCTSGWEGTNCELETDECASNPCVNGGTCTDAFDHFTCACSPGVTGATCDVIEDSCVHLAPCENGATCRPTNGSYSCLCVNGYTGRNCVEEIDECDPNPCQNGGICQDAFASFTCTCVDGYTGDNCQVAPTTTTKPTTTTATTTVTTTTIATTTTRATTTATRRPSATTSKFCSQQSALLCMNGGSCVVVDNSRESCLCQEGFSGATCQTVDKNSPDYLHALIATSVGSFVCILLMLALLCLVLCKKKRAKRCENISNGRRGDGASDHVTKPEDLQPTKEAWGERLQAAIDPDFTSPKGAVGSATYDIVRSPDLVTSPMYSARYNPAGYFYENPNAMVQPYNCQSMQVGSKRRHSTTNSFMHSNRDQLFSVGDVINAVEPNKEDNDIAYRGHKNDTDSRNPHHIKGHKPVKNRHKSTKDNSDVKIPPHTAAALINYLSTALGRDRQHQGRKKTPEKPPSETNVLKDIDSDGLTNEIASPRRADVQINQTNDRTRQRRTKWRSPGKDNCDSLELDNLKLYDYFDQFASDRKGRAVLRLTRENAFLFE